MITDFVIYMDTDSCYIRVEDFILQNIDKSKWESLDDEKKITIIQKIGGIIEKNINDRIYNETQIRDYNSQVNDFKIRFEQETIAKTALFVKKKKYAYWAVCDGNIPIDKISATGLEIVRSDSSEAIRVMLRHLYELIMKRAPEGELLKAINKYKNELKDVLPEEIAANISVNNIDKYIGGGRPIKGTPWHIKGVYNYNFLLETLKLKHQYESIYEGSKARVVYIKKNKFNIDTVTFQRWPKEFDTVVNIDYSKMIEKFFINKIKSLLEPIGEDNILSDKKQIDSMTDLFFNN